MIIHSDADWPHGTLERFALVVAQHSVHFALQLHWIVAAAMEDYAPEVRRRGPRRAARACGTRMVHRVHPTMARAAPIIRSPS